MVGAKGRNPARLVVAIATGMFLIAGCGSSDESVASLTAAPTSSSSPSQQAPAESSGPLVLLKEQTFTVLDQRVKYPTKKPAQISSSILTLLPGDETGWHKHGTPLYAYVLEGKLTVDYEAGVTKEFTAGTALLEAINVWHNGSNKSQEPVRILVVNLGAKGVTNTVMRP